MLGDAWQDLGTPNAACNHIEDLCYLGQGIVLAGARGTAATGAHWFRSTDYGLTWVDMGAASAEWHFIQLVNVGNGIVVGGLGPGDSDVVRSTDWGQSFVFIKELDVQQTSVWGGCYCGSNIVLLGTSGLSWAKPAKVFRSLDGGLTWDAGQSVSSGMDSANELIYLGGGIVLAGTQNNEIARSVNSGQTWTINIKNVGNSVEGFADLGGGVVLCATDVGTIWRSADYGATWTQIVDIGDDIECLIYGNEMVFAGISRAVPADGGVYRSLDGGYTWTDCGAPVPPITKVRSLEYFETETERILLAGMGNLAGDAHIARAIDLILPEGAGGKYRLKVGKYMIQCEADKQNLLECNFTLRQNGGCAEFNFSVGRPDFDISMGDEVLVYLYGQNDPWYRGRILERTRAGSSSPIRNYSGYGHFEFLNGGQLVDVTFSGAGISDLRLAVIHVLNTYVRPYGALITNSNAKIEDPSYTITELTFDMVKPIDALTDLCELAEGYEFGVDEVGDFYFRAESTAILEHKWVGKHVGTFIPTETMRNLVNRWRLEGGALAGGSNYDSMVENAASQGLWGLRSDKATIPSGMNTNEIARWGADLLAKSKDPTIKAVITGIDIERTETRIWPRGRMRLTSEDGNDTYNFPIRALTYHITPAGITADVALGPKATHIRDYIADLEKKIKKEREQLAIDVYQLALGTGLIADAIKDWHIDWGVGANQVSGVDMPIADAGAHYTTDFVEQALQEVASNQENAMALIYLGI